MTCSNCQPLAARSDDERPFDFDLSDIPDEYHHQPIPRGRVVWRLEPDGEAIEPVSEAL